ncbi:MAG TPA: ABC transporter substrate-binding protein [Candidatus Limnocylindria bacterium]|jgi:NitT/TauT family transport system substrate-binding protein
MFGRIRVLAAVTVASLVIGACAGASTAPPATSAAAAAPTAAPLLPTPELTKIRIGLSAGSEPVQFAEKLADMLGIYKKYGITTVEITGFEGDGKALQALVAGQLDLFVGGASTAINSVVTDTPLKIVSMNSVILDDFLVCQKDIKTAADVKGKSIAISTFGGTSHGSALIVIKGLGLTTKDVTITQVGGESTRIAALKGGSVPCALVGSDNAKVMIAAGFNGVFDETTAKLEWGRSGLMARTDFITKNPNTVQVVVASVLEAQQYMWTNTADATAKYADFTQKKPDDAKIVMDGFKNYGSRTMQFTEDALLLPRDVLATVNPAVANVKIADTYDLSFLKKLQSNGFYAKVGAPTP